jgi:hypothetical protein
VRCINFPTQFPHLRHFPSSSIINNVYERCFKSSKTKQILQNTVPIGFPAHSPSYSPFHRPFCSFCVPLPYPDNLKISKVSSQVALNSSHLEPSPFNFSTPSKIRHLGSSRPNSSRPRNLSLLNIANSRSFHRFSFAHQCSSFGVFICSAVAP